MATMPETYDEFCERNLVDSQTMDKYEFGKLAFIAGQVSGLNHAEIIMKLSPTERKAWLAKIKAS